jgi:hypothetical protein
MDDVVGVVSPEVDADAVALARFSIESVATRYTVAGGKWSDVAEIIVTGPGREAIAPVPDLLSGT